MATLSLVKNPAKQTLDNSGTKPVAKMVRLDLIVTADPFKTLFSINPAVLETISKDIQTNGFDGSQPLHIWKEKGILIDGHTRLEAAKLADLFQVPVFEHSFDSEDVALEYAIHMQRDRRNLSDAEMYACITELDKRGPRGGARFKGSGEHLKDSRMKTAQIIGTSVNKVQKVRTISDHAPAEVKESLKKGDLSINQAYTKTKLARKPKQTPPSFAATPIASPDPVDTSSTLPAAFTIMDELTSSNRIVITFPTLLSIDIAAKLIFNLNSTLDSILGTPASDVLPAPALDLPADSATL